MSTWIITLGLQAAIVLLVTLIGKIVLRLNGGSSLLAALMVTPVPLFQVTPGAAGFIYTADLLAVLFFLRKFSRPISLDSAVESDLRPLLRIALIVTVLLPLVSTMAGYVTDPQRNYKEVALGLGRGLGYWVIFRHFAYFALRESRCHSLILLQVLAFTGISVCGIMQDRLNINLDLWNEVRGLDPTRYSADRYGGGFMGMYRGAVGAWAAGILAVAPVVWGQTLLGIMLLPFAFAIMMGGVLATGSRQGLVVGVVGFVIGSIFAAFAAPREKRSGALIRNMLGLLLVGLASMVVWQSYAPDSLKNWFDRRFQDLLNPAELFYLAATRDPRIVEVYQYVTSKLQMLMIGTGYGTMTDSPYGGGILPRIYVDSELFFILQLGGIVLLSTYAWFLIRYYYRLQTSLAQYHSATTITIKVAQSALVAGLMLTYGHFFLMTTDASQAPVGYWNWSVLGMALGYATLNRQFLYGARKG